MFLVISEVLTAEELAAMREHLAGVSFRSGAATAGGHARQVKNNEQASIADTAPVLKKVEAALMAHPVFKSAARPKAFVKTMVSRYQLGMRYGLHVDDPLMNGTRTDLSLTLFLAEPDTYEGGELIVEENSGDRSYKLPAGSLILYPTTSLHRVNDVTSGQRLAVVGWIRSYIRNPEQRELLFDMDNTIASLQGADRSTLDMLYKIRANLLRMWAED